MLLIASAGLFGLSVASAQTTPPAQAPFAVPPFKNLKVFPQTISRAELIQNMKAFTSALGVRCTYCHVGTEGQPLSTYDFASDKIDHKDIARGMLRMADRLNDEQLPAITGLPDAKVTCFTCHRGSTKPATEPPAATPAAAPAAVPSKPERA